MTYTLPTSVPGVYSALFGLVSAAAASYPAYNGQPVGVFAFEIGQYVPGAYITVHKIIGPKYTPEAMPFTMKEVFQIVGAVKVFTGDSVTNKPTVALDVLTEVFNLFSACVVEPLMTNNEVPILGTSGPSPYVMLPVSTGYTAEPGVVGDEQAGWEGVLSWAYQFEALQSMQTPA